MALSAVGRISQGILIHTAIYFGKIASSCEDVQAALLKGFNECKTNATSTAANDKDRFESHESGTNVPLIWKKVRDVKDW